MDQQDGGFEAFFRGSIQKINEQYAEFYEIYSFWNLTLAHSLRNSKAKRIKRIILQVQKHLFIIGAELSWLKGGLKSPKKGISEADINWLELLVEEFEEMEDV